MNGRGLAGGTPRLSCRQATRSAGGWQTGRAQGGGFPRMAPRGDGLARARARK